MSDARAIQHIIQPYLDAGDLLGAGIVVIRDGALACAGGFGVTSVEEGGKPVTPNTLFAYGSISKTLCATLILRLVERGLLDLDAPVSRYLPGFRFSDPAYGQQVTLRHLLSHTSGLPMAGKNWGPRDPDSLCAFVWEQIPHYAFLAEPGRIHLYSNTVICVAGYVAEAVTGRFYDQLVQEYVFEPLKMARSTFDPAVAMTYPIALPHHLRSDGELATRHRMSFNASGNPSSFAYGSALDLANLALMFLNRGSFQGRPFLSPGSVEEMWQRYGRRYVDGASHPFAHLYKGYGLGFMVGNYQGRRVVQHGGMNLSYQCFFHLFPDEAAGLVLLTNWSREDPLMELVLTLYDQILGLPRGGIRYRDKPDAITLPPEPYQGTYLNVASGTLAEFGVQEGTLTLTRSGETMALVPFDVDRFYGELSPDLRIPVAFLRDRDGALPHVMIGGAPYHRIERDPSFAPDPSRWHAYEGEYRDPSNANPDEVFRIEVRAGQLIITAGTQPAIGRPLSKRSFVCQHGLIEFEPDAAGPGYVLQWGKSTRYFRDHLGSNERALSPAHRQER